MILLWCCTAMQAITITGYVRDAQDAAMPFVTISLLSADSTLISGTITTDDGAFAIDASATAIIIRASYMGYVTQYRSLASDSVYQGERIIDFILVEETTQLSEVVVSGRQKLVERRMDKIVMNVASSPFAIGNNGKDILRKAPGVNIDRKGKITVNGKAVEVYIDGRPSYLSGEQLKTMLEGTDGSTINRLEIITQPSARYDAAGQGGIINIRTKRNLTKGINGSLSAGYGGMYWRDLGQYVHEDHTSLNLHYRGAKTYTSAAVTQQYSNKTETYTSLISTPEEERTSQSRTRTKHQYYMLKLSNDWCVDSVNTLGAVFSAPVSLSRGNGLPEHNYSTLMQNGACVERNTEARSTFGRWLQHTLDLNYTHTFSRDKEQELSVNLDYNRNNNRQHYRTLSIFDSQPEGQDVTLSNHHTTDIYSARLDFESQFWQTGKVECGAKWQTSRTGYRSETDTLSASRKESALLYTEHIAALYITAGKQFGEHWTTKLGLRGEYTRSQGQWLTADSSMVRSYFNLFPTAFVSYIPTEDWTLSLDYTRRIQRPSYTMLDPSVQVEDAHSIRVGNTELKPAFTHNLLVSFGYSEYVSLDFDFAHTTGNIDYQTTIQPGGDRVSRAMNYGTNTSHGIHLSLTEVPLVPKFSSRDADGRRTIVGAWLALTAQAGVMREHYRSYDKMLDLRHWSADIYAELNAYLPHDWTLSVDGYYATPSVWSAERMSAWKELNLAVKKDFPKHGLTLSARVNDLMLSSRWSSKSLGLPDGFSNMFIGNDRAHMLTLGLTWKFGSSFYSHRSAPTGLDSDRLQSGYSRRGRRE